MSGTHQTSRLSKTLRVEWVERADEVLLSHGAVRGDDVHPERPHARRRAQSVIAMMVDLGLHERFELVEHTERRDGGWGWSIELASNLEAPDATYVRQRWIAQHHIDWANHANDLLLEHGVVTGVHSYDSRHQARYRSQKLIRLLVELRLRERWELAEHVEKRGGRWTWSVLFARNGKPVA
jgi:hypothetical protein